MQEQDYLTFVLDVLRRKIKEIDVKMAEGEQDIAQMHAYFWENYNEFDEYGYEVYDNSAALKSRMREQKDYTKERSRYEKMLDSPYFGRVDFCYEGEKEPERRRLESPGGLRLYLRADRGRLACDRSVGSHPRL